MNMVKKTRKEMQLGTLVNAVDGRAGKISKVIIDPRNREPIYLVVKTGRLLRTREVTVPISLVSSVSAESVNLGLTREALAEYPDYEITVHQGHYEKPLPLGHRLFDVYTPPSNSQYLKLRQRSVPEYAVAVEKGMLVRDCNHQEVGRIEGVVPDTERWRGKYLVFRRRGISRSQQVPVDLVAGASSEEVRLGVDWKFVENFPDPL